MIDDSRRGYGRAVGPSNSDSRSNAYDAAARRLESPDDERHARAVGERKRSHEERLAERRASHDDRAVVILQRAGDERRRARRSFIDEHGDRVAALAAEESLNAPGIGDIRLASRGGVDDGPAREEFGGDRFRFVDPALAVAAERVKRTAE